MGDMKRWSWQDSCRTTEIDCIYVTRTSLITTVCENLHKSAPWECIPCFGNWYPAHWVDWVGLGSRAKAFQSIPYPTTVTNSYGYNVTVTAWSTIVTTTTVVSSYTTTARLAPKNIARRGNLICIIGTHNDYGDASDNDYLLWDYDGMNMFLEAH